MPSRGLGRTRDRARSTVRYTRSVTRGRRSRGWFITIEGPDGSGKTDQAARLRARALAAGIPFVLAREPGGTAAGERIRDVLFGSGAVSAGLDRRTDALLFNASRAQLVAEVVEPSLAAGALVVATRFADSTVAYQGHGSGLSVEDLRTIERFTTAGLRPDLTILLDLEPEIGLGRKAVNDHNKFETHFDLDFHRRVRAGYLAMAADEPERFAIVDANRSAGDVFGDVLRAIERLPDGPNLGVAATEASAGNEPLAARSRIPG